MSDSFMDKLRSFFGIRQETPRNDFRNPIWGSDDEDDEDELYSRQHLDAFPDPNVLQEEFGRQMQQMFRSFGNIFGDMKIFFNDDHFDDQLYDDEVPSSENYDSGNLRDYYLKPGYHGKPDHPKQDADLDGQISSQEISGLLKQKKDVDVFKSNKPFDGSLVPGRSFCQTIITTSITKPDGSVETKRIVKNGNEVVEEIITSSRAETKEPFTPAIDGTTNSFIYQSILPDLSSFFKNIH